LLIEHMYDAAVHGDDILSTLAEIDRLTARVATALADFDPAAEGAVSVASWLRDRAGMTGAAAAALARTAQRLRSLPVTRGAWAEGSLSGGQVAAVVANVSERCVPLFAEQEHEVVPWLAPLSTRQTACAMRHWRARAEAVLDGAVPTEAERSVHLSRALDGRFELSGSLDVEGGETVAAALRLAAVDDFERVPALKRADALVDVCRFYLDHHTERRSCRRHRPHLHVVVDWEALVDGGPGRVVGGGFLDGVSVQRLLCDANVHRVVTDGRSTVLDYGTATRTVPANLWQALVLRDEHCRHAGCDRPAHWCEAHHVVPVLKGGPTSVDNLVLKCTRHHHMGHLPGWHEELRPDGTLVTTDPQGRTRTTRPPGLTRDVMRGCMPSHARGEGGTRRRSAAGGVQRGKRRTGRHPAAAPQFDHSA
jgi:hypothetical protein